MEKMFYPECSANVEGYDEHPGEGGHEEEVHDDGQREAAQVFHREVVVTASKHGRGEGDVAAEQRQRKREQVFPAQILKVRRKEGGQDVEREAEDRNSETDDGDDGHGAAELGHLVGGRGQRGADHQNVVDELKVVVGDRLVVLFDVDDARVQKLELAGVELKLGAVDKRLAQVATVGGVC